MRHALLLTMFVSALGLFAMSQDSVTITSDPKDLSRPVSTLVDQIRKREKISITYEDPRYSNSADIEDVTTEVSKASALEKTYGPRILVPKGRSITFVYASRDAQTPEAAKRTIDRMLREYASLGGPVFAVTRDGVRLHVVPSEVLDASGDRVRQDSVLEAVISVPPGPRDGGQLLQAICDQIQMQTGYEIGIGPSVPGNNLVRYKTTQGIEDETARAAISTLLDRSSFAGAYDWDLYYGPDLKTYMLNFSYLGLAATPVAQ